MCTKGYGVIQIMDPGQSTVQVDAPSSGEECKPPPEPGFFESLLDDLMMTGVANAPGPNDCTVGNESTAKQALDFALLVAPVKVGVANKALKGTTNTGNRARRAAATGAVTLQMGALRYGRAGRGAVRAGRNRARYAAYQLHAFLVKHEIEPGASGDLSSKDPKKRGKLFLLQKAIKEAIKIAAG
jgi:hypothetical protein